MNLLMTFKWTSVHAQLVQNSAFFWHIMKCTPAGKLERSDTFGKDKFSRRSMDRWCFFSQHFEWKFLRLAYNSTNISVDFELELESNDLIRTVLAFTTAIRASTVRIHINDKSQLSPDPSDPLQTMLTLSALVPIWWAENFGHFSGIWLLIPSRASTFKIWSNF